ncbi:MAG: hypothetical protein ACRD2I_10300 [Vicinamibacterales bacterium]
MSTLNAGFKFQVTVNSLASAMRSRLDQNPDAPLTDLNSLFGAAALVHVDASTLPAGAASWPCSTQATRNQH